MTKTLLSFFGVGLLVVSSLAPASPIAAFKDPDRSRTLTGRVVGRQDQPLHKAVVYLKNAKSLAVKTYISDPDGGYRFLNLSPNVDYEVYADYEGGRSDTKTLSAFDTRNLVNITLRIE
jgi:hypothetical protein